MVDIYLRPVARIFCPGRGEGGGAREAKVDHNIKMYLLIA